MFSAGIGSGRGFFSSPPRQVTSVSLVDGVTPSIVLAAIRCVGIRACLRGVAFDAGAVLMSLASLAGWWEDSVFPGVCPGGYIRFSSVWSM